MKGFIEKVLLVVETIVVGFQVTELPHLVSVTVAVLVAVMAVVVLIARHTNMMYGMKFNEDHTHEGAPVSKQIEHKTNCALCKKHDRSRYF